MKINKPTDETLETLIAFAIVGVVVISFIGLIAGWWNPFVSSEEDDPNQSYDIALLDSPTLGAQNASVQIIEFSDFSCGACARFAQESKAHLQSYIDDGVVSLTFKHYPLTSIHPRSLSTANAAVCAHNQGAFWEFHDALFANMSQREVGQLQALARDIGLNMSSFNDCLITSQEVARVQLDIREGQAAGVRGTPTFFINQKKVTGFLSPERLDEEIMLALTEQ